VLTVLNVPNLLTLLRIVAIPAFLILLEDLRYREALVLFVAAGLTDGLDGAIARLTHTKTTLGAFLDPAADKALLVSAFIALGFMHAVPRWLVVLVISRDVVIVLGYFLLFVMTGQRMDVVPAVSGKASTALQLLSVTFVLLGLIDPHLVSPGVESVVFYATGAVTAFAGLQYMYRGLAWLQRETMPPSRVGTVVIFALVLAATVAHGETAREILDRRKALDDTTRHWDDRHQKMKLTIYDKRGGERVREMDIYDRREPGDEQKTILFFLAPAEVKGTGFLAFTHKGRAADQWLYLPELQRVRQITARTRNESFMGTDLSYHDLDIVQEMVAWTEDDARSSLRGEESLDGTSCQVIDLAPQRDDIGYKKITVWLGKDDVVPRKLELYEDGSEPKKRIVQGDVKTIGTIPIALHVDAATPAAGSHTAIEITDVQFNQKLDPEVFTQRYLERGGIH